VALVRTDVPEELSASFIRVVPSLPILVTLMMEALSSSETSVLTRATGRNIPEGTILHTRPSFKLPTSQYIPTSIQHMACTTIQQTSILYGQDSQQAWVTQTVMANPKTMNN
jgi:hypothetical protein